MSNHMRADFLAPQGRSLSTRLDRAAFDQSMNARSGHWLIAAVEKQRLHQTSFTREHTQCIDGGSPERATPLFASFAENRHTLRMPIDISDLKLRCLARPCPGVVQEQEQCMFAPTLASMVIVGCQQRIHFLLIQIGNRRLLAPLEGNQANLATPVDVLGAVLPDKSRQCMNPAEALIASTGRAVALLFHVGQE